ncbi:hypothetical protein Tco_1102034 [Tanacetum coccineum]
MKKAFQDMLHGLGEVNPVHAYYNGSCTSKDNEDPSWSTSFKTRRTQKTSSALEVLWKTLFLLYLYLIGTLCIMPSSRDVDHHDTTHYIPMYHRTGGFTGHEREIYKSLVNRLFHEVSGLIPKLGQYTSSSALAGALCSKPVLFGQRHWPTGTTVVGFALFDLKMGYNDYV